MSDAAEIALALGRVLVEPATRNGRCQPFDAWQRGARATLGSYWDLRPIERQQVARLSALLDASANCEAGWRLDDAVVVRAVGLRSANRIAKQPADEVRRFFAVVPDGGARPTALLSRFKPTVAHSGGHNFGAFGGAPYLPTAPALVREAEAITGELGRFACVQWRAERSSPVGGLMTAAADELGWLREAARRLCQRGWRRPGCAPRSHDRPVWRQRHDADRGSIAQRALCSRASAA